jgi:hypothetical protein
MFKAHALARSFRLCSVCRAITQRSACTVWFLQEIRVLYQARRNLLSGKKKGTGRVTKNKKAKEAKKGKQDQTRVEKVWFLPWL